MIARVRPFFFAGALTLATSPVWAQATPDFSLRYGYGPMWSGWGWGWFPGMVFGPLLMLIIVGGTAAFIVWLVHGIGSVEHRGHSHTALDILEQRFARGEIDKAEFEDKRRLLRS